MKHSELRHQPRHVNPRIQDAECFMGGKNGEREKTILKNIVIMAKELGMTVYCGGIHTKLQEEYAREIGCDMLEGEIFYGAMRNNVFEKCFLQ